MIRFVSYNEKTSGFLRMARLLSFLDSDADKADKVRRIKAEREDGFITAEEAVELAIEFC